MLLVRYYLAHRSLSQKELFESVYSGRVKTKNDKKDFDNFLSKAVPQGAGPVYDYFKKHRDLFAKVPPFIKTLVDQAFAAAEAEAGTEASLRETIEKITQEAAPYIDDIVAAFKGRWDVVRFSAHGSQYHPGSEDPRVMRAAMEFFAPRSDTDPPRFEIRYRPHSLEDTDDFFQSRGTVLALGKAEHLMFLGWEDPSNYPLQIIARLDAKLLGRKPVNYFTGLVTRRHEKGHIFASRVLFIRSSAPSLDAMSQKEKLGMHRRSELLPSLEAEHKQIKGVAKLVEDIANRVGYQGYSGLWLEPKG
jgi:hypothetical protein